MADRLTPSKTSLVLFDMINCFVHTGNPARVKFVQESGFVDHCVRLRDAAKKAGVAVFYVGSAHREDGKDYAPSITDTDTELRPWPEGPRLMGRPPGLEGTPEVEVIPELAPDPEDYVITKHRWSAFAGTPLDLLLRGIGTDTIVLAGGATDIGIASTAFGARDMGYNLVIPHEACQTHRADCQEFFMTRVFPRMARVVSLADAVAMLTGG
jgi:ureidoacrylate peracid hydrolase